MLVAAVFNPEDMQSKGETMRKLALVFMSGCAIATALPGDASAVCTANCPALKGRPLPAGTPQPSECPNGWCSWCSLCHQKARTPGKFDAARHLPEFKKRAVAVP